MGPSLQDGHEICFVGDEAFRELSQVDPNADKLLDQVTNLKSELKITRLHETVNFQAITEDKSEEWFAKKGKNKTGEF